MRKILIIILLSLTSFTFGQSSDDYNNRGVSKMKLKNYSGAMLDFSKAIKLDSSNANAYNNRANLKTKLKNIKNHKIIMKIVVYL